MNYLKWYNPVMDVVVALLAVSSTVRFVMDHGQYNSAVILLLTAIFLKLGIIANKG